MSQGTNVGQGKLAVLMPGLGAVATTFVAGVELVKQGRVRPAGSITQLGLVPDRSVAGRSYPVRELLPLAAPEDLVFGGWDVCDEDGAEVAARAGVLSPHHLEVARPALEALRPCPGVHDPELVKRPSANHLLQAKNHRARVDRLREDIREMKRSLGAGRAVMVFTASAEAHRPAGEAVSSLAALERAMERSDRAITPTMLYAYAALQEGVPFVNGTPNVCLDSAAFRELSRERRVPVAGKDLKSGQAMIKTALAPALRARLLDGGDATEDWDPVDLFGWLGYPMQLRVSFLCRDAVLAAPLVLDLALLMDVAQRAGRTGVQEWLGFFFESPASTHGRPAPHDLFAQRRMLEDGLWSLSEAFRARATRGLVQVA